MKQIINITLGGRSIAIEDAAYEKMQAYTKSLREYFNNEEGRDEIVADIEARFSELMHDKIRKGAPHITDADVDGMIATMGRPEDFAAQDNAGSQGYNPNFTINEKRRLYRDANNKMLGGVCSGIANWLNIDPTVVRILFIIVSFGAFGSGILIYIALWIFLPARTLEAYRGKRMFRDPENKWFGGVAGGISAYFNTNVNAVRGIMALPLIISILNGVLGNGHFGFFPGFVFSGLTGTFIFIYIVLWIVLPEALTPYQKMEMRGQNIDVNTIKQNVQHSMGDINERLKNWGQEVKESADNLSKKAGEWGKSKSSDLGRQFTYVPPKSNRGIGYVFAMIFKAIFVIIGGIIAVSLLAVFITVLFSGFAFAPVNNFLWTSETQQMLGWGTLILFIGAPVVGLVIWLIRRILNVRTPGNYLNWTFGGLWAIGWICLMFFLASMSNDFKRYESVEENVAIQQPSNNKMIFRVSEPELFYEGNFGWMRENDNDLDGFSLTEDTLKLSTVNLDFNKSEDSLYHVTIVKQSMGKTDSEALARAKKIKYSVSSIDSVLDLPAGFAIDKSSKYRAQNVLVLISVPVGKKINIDETVFDKLRDADIEFNNGGRRVRSSRYVTHNIRRYRSNTDYIMQSDGSFESEDDKKEIIVSSGTPGSDNYRWDGDSTKVVPPAPPAPPALESGTTDSSSVYRYNESPSQNKSKEEIAKELEQKQKEIEELKKKLGQ
ncbi:PspC domain-containing protein [Niabella ginsengisoli]|uniref:PspC domain-containing protein n=1 Tax=Niabella ginsengisoli TaxID=522298 RepID=A0ABS9SMB8_9BACT|nr:PspC domain-containing protein [Niabella ginsengisoli]MCH5599528.1 PspC domain-containing protein [Niabella ginsengisoli]